MGRNGAAILILAVFSAFAWQRGGGGIGGADGGDCISPGIASGSASTGGSGRGGGSGMGRTAPCQDQRGPTINPAVRAKADHQQNLKDAARLVQLANEVQRDLQTAGELRLSVAAFKKAEEMEKLSKKLHDRMRTSYTSEPKPSGLDATKRGRGGTAGPPPDGRQNPAPPGRDVPPGRER